MMKKKNKYVVGDRHSGWEWASGDSFVIARKIAASLAGKLTEEEENELSAWRASSDRNRQLYDRILDEKNRGLKKRQFDSFDKEIGWEEYRMKQRRGRGILREWARLARYAAVLLIPLGVAVYVGIDRMRDQPALLPVVAMNTIEPGGAKASLILSTGTVVDLAAVSGIIRVDDGTMIQNQGNLLSYRDTSGATETDVLVYNEVTVPKGGEYQLVLSDGTLVYLNSMSRIRYPVKFSGERRDVELEGEAYFEVARDEEKPFVVKTACYDVMVLGTRFNVTAYRDEALTSTTLVEGAVAISGEAISGVRQLRVDERFVLDKETGKVNVEKVDVSYYTAWKEGKFRFRDVRLEEIMRLVERWYDVTVHYDGEEVKNLRFGFNMSRHETIEPLLRVFELNGKVKIDRAGKVLTVRRGR